MPDFTDHPEEVRAGEALDRGRLGPYLQQHVPELADASEIVVRQFPSGHSNLTYSVEAGGRQYVLRRPPFGNKVKSAHDMGREYRILSKLHAAYPLAPEPVVFCEDDGVIGANFYVMRRIPGIILRKELPPELERKFTPDRLRGLHLALVANLARIHTVDYEKVGLGDLGKPDGYVERQVAGWTKRYDAAQTDDVPVLNEVGKWLAAHLPTGGSAALIHNDYKMDNLVLDPNDLTNIVGVLDWEMSTIGDPRMEIGTFLGYWVEAGDDDIFQLMKSGPTTLPGSLTRAELVAEYERRSGRVVENPVYYYAFGLFKNAVVAQQIYYRYKQGLTKDERFSVMILGVRALADKAARHIAEGHV